MLFESQIHFMEAVGLGLRITNIEVKCLISSSIVLGLANFHIP